MAKYDFLSENLRLRRMPLNAQEAYNKLKCLDELQATRDTRNTFCPQNYSKRRERLARMLWAFRNMEVTK